MGNKEPQVSFFDKYKSMATVFIWVVGLIFGAGAIYNKIGAIEKDYTKQDKLTLELKTAQVRTADAVERMEKSQDRFTDSIMRFIDKMNDRQILMESRISINEVKINSLEKR